MKNELKRNVIEEFCSRYTNLEWPRYSYPRSHCQRTSFLGISNWSCNFLKPCMWGRPWEPISNVHVTRQPLYPAFSASWSSSRYLPSFLCCAASNPVSKGIVSSSRVRNLLISSHKTTSGRRSDYIVWLGREYPTDRSTVWHHDCWWQVLIDGRSQWW